MQRVSCNHRNKLHVVWASVVHFVGFHAPVKPFNAVKLVRYPFLSVVPILQPLKTFDFLGGFLGA